MKATTLQEKEMLHISKKIPNQEKLYQLAACLEMTQNLNYILQDPFKQKRAGFELLYEWVNNKGGVRDEMVEVLQEIDLPHLANM